MPLSKIRLVHDPFRGYGSIKLAKGSSHPLLPLYDKMIAQVNGRPMSDKERNDFAAEMVRRWNLVADTMGKEDANGIDTGADERPVRW